jgi:hypothetical protein
MNNSHRDNIQFISRFTKCREANGISLTVHLTELQRLKARHLGATLCDGDYRDLLPMPDGTPRFDPPRDLPSICPGCRVAYERMARERLGMPVAGRLTF